MATGSLCMNLYPALRVVKLPTKRSVATSTLKMSSSSFRISNRTTQTLDPCVVLMKKLISQHEEKWKDDKDGIFSLAQGVVYWKPPNSAYEAMGNAINDNFLDSTESLTTDGNLIHTYCQDEGYPPLIAQLKNKLEQQNGLNDPHVMVTSGANQAYVNCVVTLLDEGNKCVVFEPYYFNHVMAVQSIRGGKNCGGIASAVDNTIMKDVEGLLVGPSRQGIPDLDWLRSQLEHHKKPSGSNDIRMVTLTNPGNPTGVSLPHEFLKELTQLTKEFGVWLVMDLTYEHFDIRQNNRDATQPAIPYPCLDEEHVINIFSFSKGYALAGFRVGYLAFSSKNGSKGKGTMAYEQMLKVQDTIAICTPRISQIAALGALAAGRDWVYEQVKTLDIGRKAILDAIGSLEEIIGGDGAMYVMGKLPGQSIDDKVRLQRGVGIPVSHLSFLLFTLTVILVCCHSSPVKQFASSLVEHYGVAVIPGSFCGYPGESFAHAGGYLFSRSE